MPGLVAVHLTARTCVCGVAVVALLSNHTLEDMLLA
jgi:hypothetical protein